MNLRHKTALAATTAALLGVSGTAYAEFQGRAATGAASSTCTATGPDACAAVMALGGATAATTSYQFTTTVRTVNPAAPGFPASLSGVAAGAPVTGLLTFDAAALPSANPFSGSGFFGDATYYMLPGATMSLNIAGAVFNTWLGSLAAFVWDGTAPGDSDGVLFTNIEGPSPAQFQLGNTALAAAAFSSTALPSSQSLGPLLVDLGLSGSSDRWLTSQAFTATQAVPEPASVAMLTVGLAGLLLSVRRQQRAATTI